MADLTEPAPFLYVVIIVVVICLIIAMGIFFVNMRTKKLECADKKSKAKK
ncbi:MAG: hypothetical protein LBH45_03695 [Campylobacteraceae bacterium]|jgi:signal transduction histidine kinase|nr:hypothetical protein [Campylobacteraceae bacterium]